MFKGPFYRLRVVHTLTSSLLNTGVEGRKHVLGCRSGHQRVEGVDLRCGRQHVAAAVDCCGGFLAIEQTSWRADGVVQDISLKADVTNETVGWRLWKPIGTSCSVSP
jgi:hypothetical protein